MGVRDDWEFGGGVGVVEEGFGKLGGEEVVLVVGWRVIIRVEIQRNRLGLRGESGQRNPFYCWTTKRLYLCTMGR